MPLLLGLMFFSEIYIYIYCIYISIYIFIYLYMSIYLYISVYIKRTRVGHAFFSKERNVLGSFAFFAFFAKERCVLCVLLRS